MLINGLTELEVEAFPQDLPERVVVDIAALAKIGDAIHVKDIVLSDKVTILSAADEMVVLATAPAKEEVEEVVTPEVVAVEEGNRARGNREGQEGKKKRKLPSNFPHSTNKQGLSISGQSLFFYYPYIFLSITEIPHDPIWGHIW